jgi:hypothetical protein
MVRLSRIADDILDDVPDDRKDSFAVRSGRRLLRVSVGVTVAFILAVGVVTILAAQQKPLTQSPLKSAQGGEPNAPTAQPQQALPISLDQALYLIRSTLLTLNDANRSGNYTVLRDLAAPDFQAKNTAADLSQSFSDLRRRRFDLYNAAVEAPQLTTVPALDDKGMLYLAGFFPTRPLEIKFDLIFQNVGGQWRLFGISIATPEAPHPQAQSTEPAKPAGPPVPAPQKRPTLPKKPAPSTGPDNH